MKKQIEVFFLCLVFILGLIAGPVTVFALEEIDWRQEPDLPIVNRGAAVHLYEDKIYVIGGTDNIAGYNSVYIFDIATETWTIGNDMPNPRGYATSALVEGKIYMISGSNSKASVTSPTNDVQIYDIAEDAWSIGAVKPTAVVSAGATVYKNKIYVFGGSITNTSTSSAVEIYDIATNSWSKGVSMPRARQTPNVTIYNDKIYITGGRQLSGGGIGVYNQLDVYNPGEDTWETLSPNELAVFQPATVIYNDQLFVMGGAQAKGNATGDKTDVIQVYDFASDTWRIFDGTLPYELSSSGCILHNGRIYIVGGVSGSGVEDIMYSFVFSAEEKLYVLLKTGNKVQLSLAFYLPRNLDYNWYSTDNSVATVAPDGMVTAVGKGTCDIYCESADGSYTDFIPVKVRDNAEEIQLAVHLIPGEQQQLWLSDNPVNWSSQNPGVVSINNEEEIFGVAKGLCIVEGEIEGRVYTIFVRVSV